MIDILQYNIYDFTFALHMSGNSYECIMYCIICMITMSYWFKTKLSIPNVYLLPMTVTTLKSHFLLGAGRLESLAYQMVKKFDDMFNGIGAILSRDRQIDIQTERQTDRWHLAVVYSVLSLCVYFMQ